MKDATFDQTARGATVSPNSTRDLLRTLRTLGLDAGYDTVCEVYYRNAVETR